MSAAQEYFHFSTPDAKGYSSYQQLAIGDKITVGGNENPYYSYYKKHLRTLSYKVNGTSKEGGAIFFLEQVLAKKIHLTDDLMKRMHRVLKDYAEMYYENVFEDIRMSEYSSLPSRQKCIWLIPPDNNRVLYWRNKLNENAKLFKLKCLGTFHFACQDHLKSDFLPLSTLENYAREYWKGVNPHNSPENTEVLFEGEAEVLEEIL